MGKYLKRVCYPRQFLKLLVLGALCGKWKELA
jgi:hypothetical protein